VLPLDRLRRVRERDADAPGTPPACRARTNGPRPAAAPASDRSERGRAASASLEPRVRLAAAPVETEWQWARRPLPEARRRGVAELGARGTANQVRSKRAPQAEPLITRKHHRYSLKLQQAGRSRR